MNLIFLFLLYVIKGISNKILTNITNNKSNIIRNLQEAKANNNSLQFNELFSKLEQTVLLHEENNENLPLHVRRRKANP